MPKSASPHLATIPSVDRLLQEPRLMEAAAVHGRQLVTDAVRDVLGRHRTSLRQAGPRPATHAELVEATLGQLLAASAPSLRQVFNLTGTVLHTNLGRAVLPEIAAEAAKQSLLAPSNLEFDLDEGQRGERDAHLEGLVCRLTGAQAATIVNNNAAAVLLALSSIAKGKDVLVSRGELVEIGGAFRIPEVIESAGCRLVEVGTTNRTHLRDYESAIGVDTAALVKVHTSNYAIVGFVASASEADLATLAHARGLPFITDLGSGSLVDMTLLGLPAERTPMESLRDGADLVCFSGDKLLGGAQAGFVVGRRELVERLRRNPLKRALRLDKARIAALEAVLRLYLNPDRVRRELPTLRLLARPHEEIVQAARRVAPAVQAYCGTLARVEVAESASQIGSGSLPVDRLPSAALKLRWNGGGSSGVGLAHLAAALRALPVPVIGRVQEDALWLDIRCLDGEENEGRFVGQLKDQALAAPAG